jgi:hypothetical protein
MGGALTRRNTMILGAVTRGTGSHLAGWRHPSVTPDRLKAASKLSHDEDAEAPGKASVSAMKFE